MGTTHATTRGETIRVVVADRLGTRRLRVRHELSPSLGFDVIAEAIDATQALAVTVFTTPDLVLLHPELPDDDQCNIVSELAARCPRTVVLIHADDQEDLQGSVRELVQAHMHRLP